jgi:predicted ABC-type ATPase
MQSGLAHAGQPTVLMLAGPNGAGKTTSSRLLVPPGIVFINADEVSRRLSDEGHPEAGRDIAAGRIVLAEMGRLESERASFCVETNLAGRGLVRWISRWREADFHVRLLFIALPTAEMAISRVADRVALGGHDVPSAVVRRRWQQGLEAFFDVYSDLVDDWELIDNSEAEPVLVARGTAGQPPQLLVEGRWDRLRSVTGESD